VRPGLEESAEAVRGRATGVLFLSAFGALWLILGLAARSWLSAWTGVAVALGLAVLAGSALGLSRRARTLPPTSLPPEEQRRIGRVFARVNAVQWVAIFAVAFVLGRLHLDAYIPAAVTLVVGLHFFPLARAFRNPQHDLTGTVLVLWALGCLAVASRETLQSTTALGTGAILWTSAASTLGRAFRALPGDRSTG